MSPCRSVRSTKSLHRALCVLLALTVLPVVSGLASPGVGRASQRAVGRGGSVAVAARRQRLAELDVSAAAVKLLAGNVLAGSATVGNVGSARARSSTADVAWKSSDSGGLVQLGRFTVPALKPGRRHKAKFQFDLPKGASGKYEVSVCADVLGQVQERSRKDDCRDAGVVTVPGSGVKAFGPTGPPPTPGSSPGASSPAPASPTPTPPTSSPPNTVINSGPSGPVDSTTAVFAFSSNEAGSAFQCSLDTAPWEACTSPKEYTGLAQGPHTFQVRAINAAGEIDPTPAEAAWTVGTIPPVLTLTSSEAKVMVGSVAYVATPEPLASITAVDSPPTGAAPGVSVSIVGGELTVAASADTTPATMTLEVSGTGCTATECERPIEVQVPLTVTPLEAPPGPLDSFTTPSPNRVAAAENHDLTDELLVTMGTAENPGTRAQAEQAATAAGGTVSGGLEAAGIYQIRWSTPQNLTARREILETQSGVTAVSFSTVDLYAEASAGYPVAEEFDEPKWTWPYEQVHASEAWQLATGSKITVGIIDVGNVYTAHQDLNVAETIGPYSPKFHATHVAGLACAKNNTAETGGPQLGMVGMAWGCPIVSTGVEYADNSNAAILLAMYAMAFDPRVKVVNVSIAIPTNGCAGKQAAVEIAERDANAKPEFERILAGVGKNIVWTFAAGNDCLPSVASPWGANSQLPNVITVAATNSDNNLASFSDYATDVDLAAPGGMSTNTKPGEPEGMFSTGINSQLLGCPEEDSCSLFCIYQITYCGTYKTDMGTSMAAPVVAGIAALVREKNPQLSASEAGECITSTARTDGSFATSRDYLPAWKKFSKPEFQYEGLPIVNAGAAVECAAAGGPAGEHWSLTTAANPPGLESGALSSASCSPEGSCMVVGWYQGTTTGGAGSLAEVLSDGTWSLLPDIDPQGTERYLESVSCPGTSCMAVGLDDDAAVSEEWNGTSWTAHSIGDEHTSGAPSPRGVSCISASSCTAVGVDGYYQDGFADTWNGATWSTTLSTQAFLSGVACSTPIAATASCDAVGADFYNSQESATVADEWNGTTWSSLNPPSPSKDISEIHNLLSSISCTAANECTAVGAYKETSGYVALAERWDAGEWTVQSTPPLDGAGILNAVSCSSRSACTAVGEILNNADEPSPLAESWDGSQWVVQSVPVPSGGTDAVLRGVACTSPTDCIAVGTYFNSEGDELPLVESSF